jgi:hypothetical protein
MGMERRAEESSLLIQTRLTGSEQYLKQAGVTAMRETTPLAMKEKQGGFLVGKETRDASKG